MSVKSKNLRILYTDEENERLLSLIQSRIHILESESNNETLGAKTKAWKDIEREFNKANRKGRKFFRDFAKLRARYRMWKKEIDRKQTAAENDNYEDVKLSPLEEKLKRMLDGLNSEGFEGSVGQNVEDDNVKEDDDGGDFSDFSFGDNSDQNDESQEFKSERRESSSSEILLSAEPQSSKDTDEENSTDNIRSSVQTEQRTADTLVAEKMQVVAMQKQLIADQIKEKKLKMTLLKEEHERKKKIHQLEKEKQAYLLDIMKLERDHKEEMYELEKHEASLRKDVLQRKLLFFQETEEC